MSNISHTIIDLFRHGETNSGKCYIGRSDIALSNTGWQQMRSASQAYQSWQLIFSSPLKRCAAFAQEFCDMNALPLTKMDSIQEIDFGDWETKTASELLLHAPEAIKDYWSNPIKNTPPNGEHYTVFKKRVTAAWLNIVRDSFNKHSCVVCHAGVIRTIVQYILNIPDENLFCFDIKHAGITRIEITGSADEAFSRVTFLNG